jgi:hypothetical protein
MVGMAPEPERFTPEDATELINEHRRCTMLASDIYPTELVAHLNKSGKIRQMAFEALMNHDFRALLVDINRCLIFLHRNIHKDKDPVTKAEILDMLTRKYIDYVKTEVPVLQDLPIAEIPVHAAITEETEAPISVSTVLPKRSIIRMLLVPAGLIGLIGGGYLAYGYISRALNSPKPDEVPQPTPQTAPTATAHSQSATSPSESSATLYQVNTSSSEQPIPAVERPEFEKFSVVIAGDDVFWVYDGADFWRYTRRDNDCFKDRKMSGKLGIRYFRNMRKTGRGEYYADGLPNKHPCFGMPFEGQ